MKTNQQLSIGNYYTLHNEEFFVKQRIAGKCVAECLAAATHMIYERHRYSLLDIEARCLEIMKKHNCSPTFLNYTPNPNQKPFPGAICISVNKELVHGIPSSYVLQEGDVIKVDLGATFEEAIADAAITAIHGEPKDTEHIQLIETCKFALKKAIGSIAIGKRIGCIGHAINNVVKNSRFKSILDYGGHGIGLTKEGKGKPHTFPFVPNKSILQEGLRFQNGITFAIEPMLVMGVSNKTKIAEDGWTVLTENVGVHFEHTVSIWNDKIEVITV